MTADDVLYILEDVGNVVTEHDEFWNQRAASSTDCLCGENELDLEVLSAAKMWAQTRRQPFLHTVSAALDEHVARFSWKALPSVVWAIFRSQCPWLVLTRQSLRCPVSVLVLLLMVETYGSLLVVTVLFQASGDTLSVHSSEECTVEGVFASFGATIAISGFTKVAARYPRKLLALLPSREFVLLPSQHVDAWQTQLLTWRRRSRLLWMLGAMYVTAANRHRHLLGERRTCDRLCVDGESLGHCPYERAALPAACGRWHGDYGRGVHVLPQSEPNEKMW